MKLFICVPTYNRHRELACLAETFLLPAINRYPHLIKVIVADNSDAIIQQKNESLFFREKNIRYIKNLTNIGFGGNIIRLAEAVVEYNCKGYLWYLSDNDKVDEQGFASMIDAFNSFCENSFPDLIALNFEITSQLRSLKRSEADECVNQINFQEFIDKSSPFLPFIFLSTFVLSSALITPENIVELKRNPHDFSQISLCLSSLSPDSSVYELQSTMIHYQPEAKGRFKLYSIFDSYVEALVIAEVKFGISRPLYAKKFLRGLLYIVWRMKRGELELAGYPRSFYLLVARLKTYPTTRGIVLALGGFMPSLAIEIVMRLNEKRLAFLGSTKSLFTG